MEEGESVGKALAVRGQSTYCTLHSQQLRFKTTFFTFCHHICRLLTLSLLFPPIFYSQQCKLHFKHSDKLNTQQFSENETEQEQRPAGLQQGGIHSAMHTGPSGVLWVRVCAALITGRAELCIHLAARHTQMEGGGVRDHHSWIWMSWSFFERVWVWTHSSSLSLFSISLQVAVILSSVPCSLESNLTLIWRWTGQVSICAQVHKSFFFFFLSLWYNLSPTLKWILL